MTPTLSEALTLTATSPLTVLKASGADIAAAGAYVSAVDTEFSAALTAAAASARPWPK